MARKGLAESVRTSMWALPLGIMTAITVLTMFLLQVRPDPSSTLAQVLWPGGSSSASSAMQTLATVVVTAASLTFSAVLVALQLASQQFSPRLLRDFARDRLTQTVLGLLLATFAAAVTVVRSLDPQTSLPVLALFSTYLLGLVSVGLLLGFLAHMMRQLRVDTMMRTVHEQAVYAMDASYPDYDDPERPLPPADPGPVDSATVVRAARSGFCQRVDVDRLVATAAAGEAYVRVVVRPGDQVLLGTPIAYAWSRTEVDVDAVRATIEMGYERTFDQDTSFGFRRLADIAVKAISPGINDPATAEQCLGHLGDLLVRLTGKQLGPIGHQDEDGTVRATVPDRDIRFYLDMTCAQIRRYGRHDPSVLTAVLRTLRDMAVSARDDDQRAEIRRQCDLVLAEMPDELLDEDLHVVREAAARVDHALRGSTEHAFSDRSGELRTI